MTDFSMASKDRRKSVLITGCTQGGIGDSLALEFHQQGLRVFPSARNLSKMPQLQELGLELIQLDISSADSIARAASEIERKTGGFLDIIVNNAVTGWIPFQEIPGSG
jgi:1-acylglycerone phosphate reductase